MTLITVSLLTTLYVSSAAAIQVSVCHDATYDISVDATSLCSGSGAAPAGKSCPKAGDVAVADCLSTLPSYGSERCVAPEDAVCQVVKGDTWGCVLPSVGCNLTLVEIENACETWDYNGDDKVISIGSFNDQEDYDQSWFVPTIKLREIEGCGKKPTPAPTTPAPTPAATKFNATTPAPTPAATKSKPNANSPPTTSVTQSNKTETLNSTQTSASNESSTYTGKDDIVFTVTPAPINVGDNESSNGTADVQVLGPRLSNTADGDEDQTTSGKPATVSFAATASDIGGLSNELMGLLAAVVAFVAVVVAAAALVYIRSRLVREDVKEGEEEDLVVDESAEKDEELDENANSNAEPPTPVIVPSTPAAVTGQIAVTPIAASTSTKLTTPVPKVAPVSVAMASVEVTSNADSSEIEGHDHQGADNDSQ